MNFLNNSSEATRAEIGAEIKARTRAGPGVGLRDGVGEVSSKLGPPTKPGSLASSSSTGSIGGEFR